MKSRQHCRMPAIILLWLNFVFVTTAEQHTPQSGTTAQLPETKSYDLGGGIRMDFVLIRPGEFSMGDDKVYLAKPHKVTISKPFYMGKFLVTQEQWQKVMGSNPSHFKGAKNPVEMVSWNDSQDFNAKLKAKFVDTNFRLPTEAEWEYACRAGTTTAYSFGDSEAALGDYAWFKENSDGKTHEVGGKKPNPWGLYDMHGNVREWCADWAGRYPGRDKQGILREFSVEKQVWLPVKEPVDPTGPSSGAGREVRGGSMIEQAARCRSASRCATAPDGKSPENGLRLVAIPQ